MASVDLNTKAKAVVEHHGVEAAALARTLGVDKATAWRWLQNPAGLKPDKLKLLLDALCKHVADKITPPLTIAEFDLNSLSEFCLRIGMSKVEAAHFSGVDLPIPEALVDAASEAKESLLPFSRSFRLIWQPQPTGEAAQAVATGTMLPDGRLSIELTHDGPDRYKGKGFLIRRGAVIHIIGDRTDPVTAKADFFTMPLEVEYDRRGDVKLIRTLITEWKGRTMLNHRAVMIPCSAEEAQRILDDAEASIGHRELAELVPAHALRFLLPGTDGTASVN